MKILVLCSYAKLSQKFVQITPLSTLYSEIYRIILVQDPIRKIIEEAYP
jgi:hypothetical protein